MLRLGQAAACCLRHRNVLDSLVISLCCAIVSGQVLRKLCHGLGQQVCGLQRGKSGVNTSEGDEKPSDVPFACCEIVFFSYHYALSGGVSTDNRRSTTDHGCSQRGMDSVGEWSKIWMFLSDVLNHLGLIQEKQMAK